MKNTRPIGVRLHRYVRRICESWQLFVLLLPGLAYLIIFHYLPMYGVQIAFKDYRANLGIWGSPWVGLKHFTRFLNYPEFWKILGNTFFLSVYSIATFPLAIVLALMLNEVKKPGIRRSLCMQRNIVARITAASNNSLTNVMKRRGSTEQLRGQIFPHAWKNIGVGSLSYWDGHCVNTGMNCRRYNVSC